MRELGGTAMLEQWPAEAVAGYPVLVIDDHELFSTAMCMALGAQGFQARQVAPARVTEAMSTRCPAASGLVVLDLDLGRDADGHELRGADLVAGLHAAGWQVLVVSGTTEKESIAAAIAAGAVGSVPKSSSFPALLRTVAEVAAGRPVLSEFDRQQWIRRHLAYQAEAHALSQRLGRLSNREREVLELLAEGFRAAAIAERFVVSMTTVRTQIRSILAKLEVSSQLEAVALVHQQRW